MDAMIFEILIRAAFKCGRYGVPGADADIYRNFQHACYEYERLEKYSGERRTEIIFTYAKYIGIVTTHIGYAIDKILKDYRDQITPEQENTLKGIDFLILNPSRVNIEEYFRVIDPILEELHITLG